MRLEGIAKGGYYPTPEIVIRELVSIIDPPSRFSVKSTLNYPILDPCAGDGAAVKALQKLLWEKQAKGGMLKEQRSKFPLYGIEPNQERYEKCLERLDYAVGQDFFRCAVSHKAFSILWLNPPYDYDQEEKRMEHRFLTRCHNYLVPNGLLVYIIPRATLKTSAAFLSAHYCDHHWQVYQFPEPEYDAYKQIVFIGYKNQQVGNTASKSDPEMKAELIRISQEHNRIQNIDQKDINERIYVQNRIGKATAFYLERSDLQEIMLVSYQIDPLQMQQLVNKHGLWKEKEIKQLAEYTSELKQQPLMPLRKGHLALFIAAGFLNNMELNNQETGERVLIKGNTYKEQHLVEETETKAVHQEVLKAKINMLSLETGKLTEVV